MFIVWEQVPPVLPVWQACAEVLRAEGYSVWVGNLNAEMFGVPQTRKRAFLIARRDGIDAAPPVPTHSRYHNRTPSRLDDNVLPWVSMATALGWGTTGRPSPTVCGGGTDTGGAEPFGHASRDALALAYRSSTMPGATVRDQHEPAPAVAFGNGANSVRWIQRSNYTGRGERVTPSPVPGAPPLGMREMDEPSSGITSKGFKWVYRNGNQANTAERAPDQPAPSVHFGARMNSVTWESEAASIRVSVQEAAILQTFPADHPFQGAKGKQYLQIGNAVPPLLGQRVLKMFLDSGSS
jgi:DNA (cytosine-5)-methyltransferase 1